MESELYEKLKELYPVEIAHENELTGSTQYGELESVKLTDVFFENTLDILDSDLSAKERDLIYSAGCYKETCGFINGYQCAQSHFIGVLQEARGAKIDCEIAVKDAINDIIEDAAGLESSLWILYEVMFHGYSTSEIYTLGVLNLRKSATALCERMKELGAALKC